MKVCTMSFSQFNDFDIDICIIKDDGEHCALGADDLGPSDTLRFVLRDVRGKIKELCAQIEDGAFDESLRAPT